MNDHGTIANLTQHQTITDVLLNTMGETMAVQQALFHIPVYDGRNMALKTFLQDVENGLTICPEGIHNAFFKGVIAKLRGTARDAVSGIEINTINDLKNALKEYFAPKKDYTHYCAELQGVRMRRGETVMEYYSKIKKIMESAKSSLRDKFTEVQQPNMTTMLKGIALEGFKRGLSDDLLYAVSVQEPEDLDAALRIARRIERDMGSADDRKGNLAIMLAKMQEEFILMIAHPITGRGQIPTGTTGNMMMMLPPIELFINRVDGINALATSTGKPGILVALKVLKASTYQRAHHDRCNALIIAYGLAIHFQHLIHHSIPL